MVWCMIKKSELKLEEDGGVVEKIIMSFGATKNTKPDPKRWGLVRGGSA